MTRNNYEESLKGLYHDTITMAGMVENALIQAMKAVSKGDDALAHVIIEGDAEINAKYDEIEAKCVNLIATQQPLARDLRLVVSVMNIIVDLERMGDHAADICSMMVEAGGDAWSGTEFIPEMTQHTIDLVKKAIDAYAYNDSELAEAVRTMEQEQDEAFHATVERIVCDMEQEPSRVRRGVTLLFVVKYLERIGDHAANLGESVIYSLTGRHEKLN